MMLKCHKKVLNGTAGLGTHERLGRHGELLVLRLGNDAGVTAEIALGADEKRTSIVVRTSCPT